jgi:mono/diheme cytochrome c family protein
MTEKQKREEESPVMSDEEMIESHVALNDEKHPPTIGFLRAPLIFVFVFGCLVFVCSIQLAKTTNKFGLHPKPEARELTPEKREEQRIERKIESGKKLFTTNCASCHQKNGLGLLGQFPPLAGSKWATSDPGLITKIVLKGLKGEIEVKGTTWGTNPAQNMVPLPLKDWEIANITTYIRQAWENQASEISDDEVSGFRTESTNQVDQWTGEQLRSLYPSVFSEE